MGAADGVHKQGAMLEDVVDEFAAAFEAVTVELLGAFADIGGGEGTEVRIDASAERLQTGDGEFVGTDERGALVKTGGGVVDGEIVVMTGELMIDKAEAFAPDVGLAGAGVGQLEEGDPGIGFGDEVVKRDAIGFIAGGDGDIDVTTLLAIEPEDIFIGDLIGFEQPPRCRRPGWSEPVLA